MTQKISNLHIDKLKGLSGLDISFDDKNITAIFGENGCGKSTILHALACFYRPLTPGAKGEQNYFTRFFKRVNSSAWAGSRMVAQFVLDGDNKPVTYEKAADRWKPRMNKRLQRDTYYIGIDSCIPSIEKESATKTSYRMSLGSPIYNSDDIVAEASNIMAKRYNEYTKSVCERKNYRSVKLSSGIQYTSLSMGAGEQRIFNILETVHSVPENSLILIDELDLTMHTIALNRLIDKLIQIADARQLQIIFTTHREELAKRSDINIRHIWKPANQNDSLCLSHTTPMCMYRLTGNLEKSYEVYVEDDVAEAIVKAVLRDENMLNYVSVIQFGDAANAFSVAAGLHIQGSLSDNQLIMIDGDVYVTEDQKMKIMKKRYSGNEVRKDDVRREALQRIKQFNLPPNEHPEHFIWSLACTREGLLAEFANRIDGMQGDQHHYIYDIFELQGETKPVFLKELIELVKTCPEWGNYVSEVRTWAQSKRAEIL